MKMVCNSLDAAQAMEARAFEQFCVSVPNNNAERWADIELRGDGKYQFYIDERVTGAFTPQELQNTE